MNDSHTAKKKEALLASFAGQEDRYIEEWTGFLRFPSISADPKFDSDCGACAQWLSNHLEGMGLRARLIETSGKPLVFAEREGRPGAKSVLFYGHYDVQPADPEELWETPPFEPTLRNGRMYARGAQDNKGQVFAFLKAVQTLIEANELDAGLKILIEGEEESGSVGISETLPGIAADIHADALMAADTGTVASGAPTIVAGLRGMIHLTAELKGPDYDLHSGVHGGLCPNPAQSMAAMLAGLHNADGSIAVEGFCDSIREPTRLELRLAAETPFDEAGYIAKIGAPPSGGENGVPPVIRVGFRPTIEVNGVRSGYAGEGYKTIIPSSAIAKITARLVPDQNPERCLKLLAEHIKARTPDGLRLEISGEGSAGPGFRLNIESQLFDKAARILEEVCGVKTAFLWEGASVPVISALREHVTEEALLVGFGSEDDRIHAPNESYSLEQFRKGYLYSALMLTSLA